MAWLRTRTLIQSFFSPSDLNFRL